MTRKCAGIAGVLGLAFILGIIIVTVLTRPGTASTLPPTVVTPAERYEGTKLTASDGTVVMRYAGIPFALPPVGSLRFRPPEPIQAYSTGTTIPAQQFKKSCWSITKKITSKYHGEDCLYLNVYVPHNVCDCNHQCSVVVWIHGGGFVAGSAFPEPLNFVARGEVIVVNINYRLGVFGFLTTEDELLPANNGLWDQVLAMRWVKDNIRYFGGDPNSITIFGESAGAMSAAIHSLSPVSSDLFNRVVMQSGAASSLLRRNPTEFAIQFGQNAGCGNRVSEEFAACLRNLSVETILTFSMRINIPDAGKLVDFLWIPTVDNVIIPDNPIKILNNRTYLDKINAFEKDYLFGLNNNDGSLAITNFMHPLSSSTSLDMNFFNTFSDHLLSLTQNISTTVASNVSETIASFYTRSRELNRPIMKQKMMDLLADAMFYAPEINMALAMSSCYADHSSQPCESSDIQISNAPDCANASGKSFLYVFDYCPHRDGCQLPCMSHGKQVLYQFPKRPFDNSLDQQLSDNFIDFLVSFIKTGNPGYNITSEEWPVFEKNLQSYLSYSSLPSIKQYFNQYRMDMWLSEVPKILGNLVDT